MQGATGWMRLSKTLESRRGSLSEICCPCHSSLLFLSHFESVGFNANWSLLLQLGYFDWRFDNRRSVLANRCVPRMSESVRVRGEPAPVLQTRLQLPHVAHVQQRSGSRGDLRLVLDAHVFVIVMERPPLPSRPTTDRSSCAENFQLERIIRVFVRNIYGSGFTALGKPVRDAPFLHMHRGEWEGARSLPAQQQRNGYESKPLLLRNMKQPKQ